MDVKKFKTVKPLKKRKRVELMNPPSEFPGGHHCELQWIVENETILTIAEKKNKKSIL